MKGFLRELAKRRTEQESLEGRERVVKCLNHREPDRIPIDFWATREVKRRLLKVLGLHDEQMLLDAIGADMRVISGPSLAGLELETYADGSFRDLWGVVRRPVSFGSGRSAGTYREVSHHPLSTMNTVEELAEYNGWPSAEMWDYSNVAEECEACHGYCVVFAGDRLDRTAQLKTAIYLRGMKQIFRDLGANPDIAKYIFGRVVRYFLEYNERVFEAADGLVDVFMMGDDFGMQSGPMMPVEMWSEFFEEGFRKFIALAHRYGIMVMHHTCGAVRPLIPLFIENGLDILQSLQPRAAGMELGSLKAEFGGKLSFHGSVDIQQTMPHGSPEDVRAEVVDRMTKGKPGGGFIICTAHNIQVDVPTANILELIRSYHDFGGYV